jgi:transcription termination/antitermination protein NusA
LSQFVDRVERRVADEQKAALAIDKEQAAALRAEIGEAAFEASLDVLGLPEHVFNILTEADYLTAGDLILTMKANPDKVLGLPGIGAKAAQAIEKAVAEAKFAEVAQEEIVAEAEVVEAVPVAEESAVEESVAEEVVREEPVSQDAAVEEAKTEEPDVTFAELFKLGDAVVVPAAEPAEDEDSDEKKAKKAKKGKKSVVLEFDEDLGEVVGRKKHKRGDDWDEDAW